MTSFAEKLILAAQENDEEEEEMDQDYVPQAKEEKQFEKDLMANLPEKQRRKLEKKQKNVEKRHKIVKKAWQMLQQDTEQILEKAKNKSNQIRSYKQQNKEQLEQHSLEIAQKVIDDQLKTEIKKVRFAGKDFLVDDKGNIMQEEYKDPNAEKADSKLDQANHSDEHIKELMKISSGFKYMNQLMEKIKTKTKTLTSLSKSKYDWKKYAKQEKIESQLEQNRKGGYLQKENFLQKTKIKQKEYRLQKKTKQE